ncbi:hypothetical protein [Methylobacterium sp. Gmos1]
MIKIDCSFCMEASDSLIHDFVLDFAKLPSFNRMIWGDSNHFVIPSLGPLSDDHCLLVSREHYRCLRDAPLWMQELTIKRAHSLAQELQIFSGMPALIFENGSSISRDPTGVCVDHVHFHVLTLPSEVIIHVLEQINALPIASGWSGITNGLNQCFDYVIIGSLDSVGVISDEAVDRQLVRKALASTLGKSDNWDWRSYPQLQQVLKISQRLKDLRLKCES